MDFVFLGTGAGVPAKVRNVSSIALELLEERGTVWLFDCGEATQHQILKTSVKPRKIEKIFITHLHGDHIFGLPGLLGSRSFQGGTDELTIYGPSGIKDFILTSLTVSGTHLKYSLVIEEIDVDGGIVFEDDQFSISALPLDHALFCLGYRIVERDRPGSLLVDKLKEEAVKPGPVFKALKNGETVELEDGRVLHSKDYLAEPKKGRVITILGDTRTCSNTVTLAEQADYLVHEATFSKDDARMAHDYFHSTTVQAAETAKAAGARNLILTHISSRYNEADLERLQLEAAEVFPNTIMAKDLLTIKVPLYPF